MRSFWVVIVVSMFILTGVTSSHAYLISEWTDVNKYWDGNIPDGVDPDDNDDHLMCWAAAGSNVLNYTGWGFDRDGDGSIELYDDLYHEFLWAFPDDGGLGSIAYEHYLSTFHPTYDWNDYFHQESNDDIMMGTIDSYLHSDYGCYLSIGGHAITAWGFEVDGSGDYAQIYVTDSDRGGSPGDPVLQTYNLLHEDNRWYLTDYGSTEKSRWIQRIDAFAPKSVPEPGTLLLLFIGLCGLAVFPKRKKK